jgi:type III secretory pathway lipoprotein EscJ
MRPIAIVPRQRHEMGVELRGAVACLLSAGIEARNAVTGQSFALIWVDDENIFSAVETLRVAGLQATALTETDVPH